MTKLANQRSTSIMTRKNLNKNTTMKKKLKRKLKKISLRKVKMELQIERVK